MTTTVITYKLLTAGGHATVECVQYRRTRSYRLVISTPERGLSIIPKPSKRAALAALERLS